MLIFEQPLGAKQQEYRGLFQHKPYIHNDLNVLERLEQPKTLIPIPAHTHSPIMKTETNTHPTQHDPTGIRTARTGIHYSYSYGDKFIT
jgi:hypothetical protein